MSDALPHQRRTVLGVMSGTSYDGIDVAAAELRMVGEVLYLRPLGSLAVDFDPALRDEVAAALPPQGTTVAAVCRLDTLLGQAFAGAARRGVDELCGGQADLIVSHGQTLYHWIEDGRVRGTLQLGNPSWIAEVTGLPVVSDLRSRDVAGGGQGAPLVSAFDALLLAPGNHSHAALNIGGIANVTVAGPGWPALAYDIGPGNALIDAAARSLFGEPYDRGGHHARCGQVREDLLEALLDEPYFTASPPKSTGKELFHWDYVDRRLAVVAPVQPDDLMATLTELTASLIARACRIHTVSAMIVSGGGTRNAWLMERIAALAGDGVDIRPMDALGIPSDAKEAYAFAVLGYLSFHGLPGNVPSCTGARRASVLGNITPGEAPLPGAATGATYPRALLIERVV